MCRFEEYGNCDEETKNQEYCIFHKPNKSEEEAREFYEKFLKKFKPKKERIWDEFEEEEKESLVFEETVDCRRYVFPKIPWGFKLVFEYAIFKGDARFYGAIFEVAQFDGATFEGGAGFSMATFEGHARFNGATFEEVAWFVGATFEGIADFREKEENSEYKFYCELSFSNAEFRKGVFIDIPSEWFKLPSAEAEACRVQRIFYEREGKKDDADRMFVRERRALRKAKVEEAKANVRKVKEEVKETNSSLRKVEKIKAELIKAFNLIKATSSYLLAKGSSFLEFLIADLTCEYGINWQRPVILWMFFVLFTFPLLYFILGGVKEINSPLDYLYFSIVTATTLGYGDLQPIGWCKLVASTEAIFGTFMWAVFLAVFARKYMR